MGWLDRILLLDRAAFPRSFTRRARPASRKGMTRTVVHRDQGPEGELSTFLDRNQSELCSSKVLSLAWFRQGEVH
jgi:hypothetical protein